MLDKSYNFLFYSRPGVSGSLYTSSLIDWVRDLPPSRIKIVTVVDLTFATNVCRQKVIYIWVPDLQKYAQTK